MRRPRFFDREEVEIKLRREGAHGEKRLAPWWARALRRIRSARAIRHQPKRGLGRALRAIERIYGRRSVVKASFRRNRRNRGWTAHARYLAREQAQREHQRGLGFDAGCEDLDMVAAVREWERRDELMWSFIVSPEDAERLDLRAHVRELASAMESDLSTRLEWVAIDHHNTDDPHVHLLIRGVRRDGRRLEINREYLKRGVRERSQELAERELGPRLEREALAARERVVRREQWTEIDRALQRRAGADRVVGYEGVAALHEGARIRAEQEIERLRYLETLNLARQSGEATWELSQRHESELRARQRAIDIIKSRARQHQRERDAGLEVER
jgi:type IV secretory pathway VirD2 relaxase